MYIVTGSNGLVGSAVVKTLRTSGRQVLGIARSISATNSHQTIRLNLTDESSIKKASGMALLKRAEVIVHCAASIPSELMSYEESASINTLIDTNVLQLAERLGASLIFMSSSSVYGNKSGITLNEDSELNPENPYSEEKIRSENLIMGATGLPSTVMRIASPYGLGMTTNNIFKLLVDATIRNEPFKIFNPERKQYFTYAADIAMAVQKTGASILNRKQIFNIIPETSTSVIRLAEIFKNFGGLKFRLDPIVNSDNDSAIYAPSITSKKALDMMGWSAETSIEDGVRICLGGPK